LRDAFFPIFVEEREIAVRSPRTMTVAGFRLL